MPVKAREDATVQAAVPKPTQAAGYENLATMRRTQYVITRLQLEA